MHTITIKREPSGWLAKFSDPAIVEAMGSDTIPTAFTARAAESKVRAELAALNPGAVILPATLQDGGAALSDLTARGFIGRSQYHAVRQCLFGEERQYFADLMVTLRAGIDAMPKVYEQDGVDDPIVHLHYFTGSCDWFITEKDSEREQHQAFGLADLDGGYGSGPFAELGYISLVEVTQCRAELDFHWAPKPLSVVKKGRQS
jgi:hypothetical protein